MADPTEHSSQLILALCFKCSICRSFFQTFEDLKSHLQNHNSESTIPDDILESRGISRILVFTGTNYFRCDTCKKQFLKSNIARNHTKCQQKINADLEIRNENRKVSTGKTFSEQSRLSHHRKITSEMSLESCRNTSNLESKLNLHDESDSGQRLAKVNSKDKNRQLKQTSGSNGLVLYDASDMGKINGSEMDESNDGSEMDEANNGSEMDEANDGSEMDEANDGSEMDEANDGSEIDKSNECSVGDTNDLDMIRSVDVQVENTDCPNTSNSKDVLENTSTLGKAVFTMKDALVCRQPMHRQNNLSSPRSVCDKRVRFPRKLQKHTESNRPSRPFSCGDCEKGFVEEVCLTKLKSKPLIGQPSMCKKQKYNRKQHSANLKIQMSTDGDGDLTLEEKKYDAEGMHYVCVKCGKGFCTCEKLMGHIRKHGEPSWLNKSDSCRATCHICNKSVNHLQKHLETHTRSKKYECEVCGKGFTERYILTKHMTSHSSVGAYECKLCNSSFKRDDNLKKHLKRIHKVDSQKYSIKSITSRRCKTYHCRRCEVQFEDEALLKEHRKSHSKKGPVMCSTCGKLFTNTVHLKTHMNIHANYRPFICETCGKTFTENSHLKRHLRVHSGERPFACPLCEKTFTQSCSLNQHMKRHQFVEQSPFKCRLCPAAFAFYGELVKHKNGHMGKDTFGCGLCDDKFSHPDDLKKHVEHHLRTSVACDGETESKLTDSVEESSVPYQTQPMASHDTTYTSSTCTSGLDGPASYDNYTVPASGSGAYQPLLGIEQPMTLHVHTLMQEAELLIQKEMGKK